MEPIDRVAIIGAGNMGSGIAQKSAQEGFKIQMVDREQRYVEDGIGKIQSSLSEAVQRRIFSETQVEEIMARVTKGIGADSVHPETDLVIEAVFEDINVKGEVLYDLSQSCGDRTIIATNTSSLSVDELANKSDRPDRFIGLHFFYHPAKNRLVEVIPSSSTSDSTLKSVTQFCRAMGKVVITCKDRPGFVVNRFFVPWLNEACLLYEEGVGTPAQIDDEAMRIFGIGMGPFALMNLTGPSIALHSTDYLAEQLETERFEGADSLRELVERGGEWDISDSNVADEEQCQIIRNRLLGSVLCISSQIVEEGVCSVEDVDRGAKVGLRWSKGPFEIANEIGTEIAVDISGQYATLAGIESPKLLSDRDSKPFEFKFIDVEYADNVAYITFNRPEAMNALNEAVIEQLRVLWSSIELNDSIHTVVMRGSGKAFIAGADIKFFIDRIEDSKIDEIYDFTKMGHDVLKMIESSEKQTIAVVSGLALGGGLELAMCCDHRIGVSGKTMLRFPETGIGIYPGLGGTQRAVRIAGIECARFSVIAGNWLTSDIAHSMGFITSLVEFKDLDRTLENIISGKIEARGYQFGPRDPDDEAIKQIMRVYGSNWKENILKGGGSSEFISKQSKMISRNAPIAVEVASRLMDIANESREDFEIGLNEELRGLNGIFSTSDALEGLKGVIEGRRVLYKGE